MSIIGAQPLGALLPIRPLEIKSNVSKAEAFETQTIGNCISSLLADSKKLIRHFSGGPYIRASQMPEQKPRIVGYFVHTSSHIITARADPISFVENGLLHALFQISLDLA